MLKASDALRVGAAKRPQAFWHVVMDGATCGQGALYEGAFGELPIATPDEMGALGDLDIDRVEGAYPEMCERVVTCPVCGTASGRLLFVRLTPWNMVAHLNDSHLWTREAIADFLDEVLGEPLELPARSFATNVATLGPEAADVDMK